MRYTHGRRSTAKPASRSRQIALKIEGGPRHGDIVTYGQPLPKILVLHTGNGWEDHVRKGKTSTYVYVGKAK